MIYFFIQYALTMVVAKMPVIFRGSSLRWAFRGSSSSRTFWWFKLKLRVLASLPSFVSCHRSWRRPPGGGELHHVESDVPPIQHE